MALVSFVQFVMSSFSSWFLSIPVRGQTDGVEATEENIVETPFDDDRMVLNSRRHRGC